jgi:hypothetical protein
MAASFNAEVKAGILALLARRDNPLAAHAVAGGVVRCDVAADAACAD